MTRCSWCFLVCPLLASFLSAPCAGLTNVYTFSVPPDNVFISIGGSGSAAYPSQLLDTQTATEGLTGIEFNNQVNNTLFVDSNALRIGNSSRMSGNYAWADARGNGPSDPPLFEIDFTNATSGVPIRVEYDFAIATTLPSAGAKVFDSEGDSRDYSFSVSGFSFDGGTDNGVEGRATIVPTGVIDDIARIEYRYGLEQVGSILQFGIDNLLIETGLSTDFGGDGMIDAQDLATWESAYGSGAGADADGDGDSDGRDYLIWQKELTSLGSLAAASVPEPTALGLAILGVVVLSWASIRPSR